MSADRTTPVMPEGLKRLLAATEKCPPVTIVHEGGSRYRVLLPVAPPLHRTRCR
jgi:hypothetical protein